MPLLIGVNAANDVHVGLALILLSSSAGAGNSALHP